MTFPNVWRPVGGMRTPKTTGPGLDATCGDCGARVSVTMPEHQQEMRGVRVGCPVCAVEWQGRMARDDYPFPYLGVLG